MLEVNIQLYILLDILTRIHVLCILLLLIWFVLNLLRPLYCVLAMDTLGRFLLLGGLCKQPGSFGQIFKLTQKPNKKFFWTAIFCFFLAFPEVNRVSASQLFYL